MPYVPKSAASTSIRTRGGAEDDEAVAEAGARGNANAVANEPPPWLALASRLLNAADGVRLYFV
jgi:hypothetical protein